ncbi:acyl carrier protein [Dactylosporangium sp. NPDC051485]|uniref:acyl carrier protein n=1 Tax=Dactylosporangium sp. NPDC051485 TaxID=3154846 RepID=UPI00342B13BA
MNEPAPGRGGEVERLVRLVRDKGFAQATADDDVLTLGLTSLQILQVNDDIEREFGVTLDIATLLSAPTIGELGKHLTGGPRA